MRGEQDVGGLPQEHGQAILRMGYTEKQTNALQIATQKTWQKAVEKLAAATTSSKYRVVRTAQKLDAEQMLDVLERLSKGEGGGGGGGGVGGKSGGVCNK